VFALPATGEGFSMAALEALAVGIPAVLSPDCNFPEAEAAGAAFIVPPQVEPVAQALERLLTDASLRRVMGHSGVRLVESRYTWDHVAAEMESVYRHYL
jgi:glycosyltransferase involved in cell wall biosynthesis